MRSQRTRAQSTSMTVNVMTQLSYQIPSLSRSLSFAAMTAFGPAHRNEKRPRLSSIQVPCSFENTFAAESMSTRRRSSVSARGGPPIPFPSIANEPLQVPCTPQESPVDAGPECRAEAHEKRRTSTRNGAKPRRIQGRLPESSPRRPIRIRRRRRIESCSARATRTV